MKANINFRLIFHTIGIILMIEALFMSLAIFVSIDYKEPYVIKLTEAGLITFFTGFFMFILTRSKTKYLFSRKDSFLLVTLSWIFMSLFGTLPYLLTHTIPKFYDAFFESMSGFTTTGASILTDIESLPKSILFWRSETHWIGGLGIIVLFIALFPSLKVGRIYLFNAEASVVVDEAPFANLFEIARKLWMIYLILTISEIILLYIAGMPIFDSVCHAFATIATGGFSTKNNSIGAYSPAIQYIIGIFMILSAINFNNYLFLLKKKFKPIYKNEELRAFLAILFSVILAVTIILAIKQNYPLEKAFRLAFFNVSSLMTATGFATDDYLQWTPMAWMMIVFVMMIGASSGSTGGGVKVIRYVLLFKRLKNIFKEFLHPNLITTVRYNDQVVENDVILRAVTFIILYFVIVFIGMLALIFMGVDPFTAFGSSLTAMGGMGPGLGQTGPAGNFSQIPIAGKYLLTALMLIGRLEIFSVFILFTKNFWKP